MHHPARILSSQSNFDKLYQLLDQDERIAKQVWELLNLLPTNDLILQQMRNVSGEAEWSFLFNPNYTFKLLYSLQVLEKLMHTTTEGDQIVSISYKGA